MRRATNSVYGAGALLAILLSGAALAACGSSNSGEGDSEAAYKVGAVLSLSGPLATLGQHEQEGAELAIEQVNAAGGINGRDLELQVLDDAGDPNGAISAFNTLAGDDEVIAAIGATAGAATLAISPVNRRFGIPLLSPNGTFEITHGEDAANVFRVGLAADREAVAASQYLRTLGADKVGLLADTGSYGSQGAELLNEVLPDAGIEVVAEEEMAIDASDVTGQLTKIRAANPDAILLWGTVPNVGVALRNAGQLKIDVPLISGVGGANPGNIPIAEKSTALPNWRVIWFVDSLDPAPGQEEFVETLQDATGEAPDYGYAAGYDAIQLLVAALEAAGDDADRAAVRESLEDLTHEGVMGEYRFAPDDHDGLVLEAARFLGVRAGVFADTGQPETSK